MVVREKSPPAVYAGERVLFLQDWEHEDSRMTYLGLLGGLVEDKDAPYSDVPWTSVLVNGHAMYNGSGERENVTVTTGKCYRLRLINGAGNWALLFSVANHTLDVIATDSQLVVRKAVGSILLHIGERYDAILCANQSVANYWINVQSPNGAHLSQAVLRYDGAGADPPRGASAAEGAALDLVMNPSALSPLSGADAPVPQSAEVSRTTRLYGAMMGYTWAMDGKQFAYPTVPPVFTNASKDTMRGDTNVLTIDRVGTVVDLVVQNPTMMAHPFHIHGHAAWYIGAGDGEYNSSTLNLRDPIVKDNIAVRRKGWMAMRFIAGNPGPWFFHCHIDYHMVSGMAMMISVAPGRYPAPPQGMGTCGPVAGYAPPPRPASCPSGAGGGDGDGGGLGAGAAVGLVALGAVAGAGVVWWRLRNAGRRADVSSRRMPLTGQSEQSMPHASGSVRAACTFTSIAS